jgi:glyoxylase-like metal-dependent hydrolase (beta-lactamase superfamily II)
MLNEVADSVWVRQSEWVSSNATVVRTDEGLVLVDPGITGAELSSLAAQVRERAQAMAAETSPDIPLEVVAVLTPLPADGGPIPGEIIEHEAHAVGHAAVLLADRGVILAGEMLSDVLIPLFDPRRPGQLAAYEAALDRLARAAEDVDVLVPGHGAVANGAEVTTRLDADRAYVDALRRGEEPADPRLDQEWLLGIHQANLEQARQSSG